MSLCRDAAPALEAVDAPLLWAALLSEPCELAAPERKERSPKFPAGAVVANERKYSRSRSEKLQPKPHKRSSMSTTSASSLLIPQTYQAQRHCSGQGVDDVDPLSPPWFCWCAGGTSITQTQMDKSRGLLLLLRVSHAATSVRTGA